MMKKIKPSLVEGNLQNCHIVIGPPRSGTSLLSNILSNGGIDFGQNLTNANEGNPEGFYEDLKLKHKSRSLYRYMAEHKNLQNYGFFLGRDRKDRIKEIILINKTKKVLETLNKKTKNKWGIKTPTLCITFRRLHHLFNNPKPIYIIRNPREMIISEVTRGGSSPTKAIELWNECVLNILNYKIRFGGPIILHHNLIKKDPKTLEAIKDYIGTSHDSIFDAIKTKLYRSKGDFPLPEYTEKLWSYLLTLEETNQ